MAKHNDFITAKEIILSVVHKILNVGNNFAAHNNIGFTLRMTRSTAMDNLRKNIFQFLHLNK